MKCEAIITKPALKIVIEKQGHGVVEERKVIKAELLIEYSDEVWQYLGENAGDVFAATLTKVQREMFDRKTGEVRS